VGNGWLGYRRSRKEARVGDIVICVDTAHGLVSRNVFPWGKRFVGLVLDKSVTVYKILVVDTGQILYWPDTATYLWKETK